MRGHVRHEGSREHRHRGPAHRVLALLGHMDDLDSHSSGGTCHGPGPLLGNVHRLGVSPHTQAMIGAWWHLGSVAELGGLRLRPWAHMLVFRGHLSTESRRYSTTLGCFRRARREWPNNRLVAALGYPGQTRVRRGQEHDEDRSEDEATILVIGPWRYRGRGHSPAAIYAAPSPTTWPRTGAYAAR